MLHWMILPFRRYAEFTGRSRRMEFWSFALLNFIVYIVLAGVAMGTGLSLAALEQAGQDGPFAAYPLFFNGSGVLFVLWWLVTLLPTVAVSVRRLHDRDLSGWWYLGMIVASQIPLIGFIAALAFLVVALLPGTPGANRFGPDPKDPASAEVFI